MKKLILYAVVLTQAILFSMPIKAAPGDASFDLYRMGKVQKSLDALEKELKSEQFTYRKLESASYRVMSSYMFNPKVKSQQIVRIFDLMLRQKNLRTLSRKTSAVRDKLKNLQRNKPSPKQMLNDINFIRSKTKTTSIIPTDHIQLAKLWAVQAWANNMWLKKRASKKSRDLVWLYISGSAGFYRYNSGNAQLAQYLQECQKVKTRRACRHFDSATSFYRIGRRAASLPQKDDE